MLFVAASASGSKKFEIMDNLSSRRSFKAFSEALASYEPKHVSGHY
jgi:hypothetical protein